MNSRPILAISVALNVALFAVIGLNKTGTVTTPLPGPQTPPESAQPPAKAAPKPAETNAAATTNPAASAQKFDWRAVESADYRKYIENLRSIGCPEETIRDLIVADVNKLFDQRRKGAKKAGSDFKFWETGMKNMMGNLGMDEESLKKKQELAAEKKSLLKDLLGADVPEKPDLFGGANPLESMLDFIPEEKQAKLMELMQELQTKNVKHLGNGTPDEVDMKALLNSQKEMEREIAKILTPKEFEDYQLRLSQTAMMMRVQLDGFNPTEQEFRDIFKVQKAYDDEVGLYGMPVRAANKEEADKRAALEAATKESIKAAIGPDRYAEMERAKDYEYKSIAKVAERQELPKEAAVQAYQLKQTAEQNANILRANTDLNEEQRAAALKAMRAETERSLEGVLGQKGLEAYKKQGAFWLNNIHMEAPPIGASLPPRPAPTPVIVK